MLIQRNLTDNQYQRKSEVLYAFTPNKSYAYLLKVKPNNLVFLETYNILSLMTLSYHLQIKMVYH